MLCGTGNYTSKKPISSLTTTATTKNSTTTTTTKPFLSLDQRQIFKTVRELILTDALPMTARLLIKHHPNLPTFYLLPKIHKFNNTGRPIVSACSCPTEHISEYLDAVLQPPMQSLPTYIKDSTHALNLIEDINQTPNF